MPKRFNQQAEHINSHYFNQASLAKSLGRYYFRKGNYELAEKYLEESLKCPNSDKCKTFVLLSKCKQNEFQPDLAEKYQSEAESVDPTDFSTIENRAKLLVDEGTFGPGWIKYHEGTKRRIFPDVFRAGKMSVRNIIRDTSEIKKSKFRDKCLGRTIARWAQEGNLPETIGSHLKNFTWAGRVNRQRELFYLERVAQEKKAYEQLLKSNPAKRPFFKSETRSIDEMRRMVDASNQTMISLYMRKPLYLHWCEMNELSGARLKNKINRLKLKEKSEHEQIIKYIDAIEGLIKCGKIVEAMQKTELLVDYKNRVLYKPKKLFHKIFQGFGAVQCLKFQDLDGWDLQENYRRKLFLLGLTQGRSLKLYESLFGMSYPNPRKAIKKLLVRVGDAKCSMEKMFLLFEIVKCHIQVGVEYRKNAQVHILECFKLAHKMNCHTYIINSTILMGSIEFPIGFTRKTSQAFNVALEYAHSIEEPGVIMFMQQMIDMIAVEKPLEINKEEKLEKEILKFVPERKKHRTDQLFESIRKHSADLNFTFSSRETLIVND